MKQNCWCSFGVPGCFVKRAPTLERSSFVMGPFCHQWYYLYVFTSILIPSGNNRRLLLKSQYNLDEK